MLASATTVRRRRAGSTPPRDGWEPSVHSTIRSSTPFAARHLAGREGASRSAGGAYGRVTEEAARGVDDRHRAPHRRRSRVRRPRIGLHHGRTGVDRARAGGRVSARCKVACSSADLITYPSTTLSNPLARVARRSISLPVHWPRLEHVLQHVDASLTSPSRRGRAAAAACQVVDEARRGPACRSGSTVRQGAG